MNKLVLKNSFGVKFEQWRYENEYRFIVNANSKECGLMDLRGYPFIRITGIIIGAQIGEKLDNGAKDFLSLSQKDVDTYCITKEWIKNLIT